MRALSFDAYIHLTTGSGSASSGMRVRLNVNEGEAYPIESVMDL